MKILASSTLVEPGLRDRAIIALLRRLWRWQAPPYALAHLLEALRPWEKTLSDALWEEIETVLADEHAPSVAALKQRILEARRVA